jgi:HNH endonuclease
MIRLTSKILNDFTLNHLNEVQQSISDEAAFENRVKKAASKWDGKNSGAGKNAFEEIKKLLIEMCIGIEICVYCENNEATDIEHIFPKKIYPDKAFSWENYVLACKTCNTTYKSDNFKIFNPQNSTVEFDVKPPRKTYLQPPNDDALFINQRIEDPMDFLELDLVNQKFIFIEKFPAGSREFLKAQYTKELLRLNKRATLVKARKNATKFFRDRLGRYVKANKALSFSDLKEAIDEDFGWVDETLPLNSEKERIKEEIKDDILSYPHITVWRELIRQRDKLPKINQLLNDAPEVLNW